MRALLLVIALFVAAPAWAGKVLIVNPNKVSGGYPAHEERNRQWIHLSHLFKILNVDYVEANCAEARTEFCRLGVMTWGFGTSSAHTEAFDAVIHLGFRGLNTQYVNCTGYDPESLTVGNATKLPMVVPQLFLGTNESFSVTSTAWSSGTTACTTGIIGAPTTVGSDITGAVQVPAGYYQAGQTERVNAHSFISGRIRHSAGANNGGFRPIIGRTGMAGPGFTVQRGVACQSCDSMLVQSFPDTVMMWERPMTHVDGSKGLLFANYGGPGPCLDSSNTTQVPCETELPILLMALARLDSMAGGALFENVTPYQFGLVIRGGASRSGRRNPGGLFGPDSASLKLTIDTLSLRNIPAVLAVNADSDSLTTYRRDFDWWAGWPALRYTPTVLTGLDSTVLTAAKGRAGWNSPIDVFGRRRTRTYLRNTDCHSGADSSINCLLRAGFWRIDSMAPGKLSRFIVPPQDDYTPRNAASPALAESVLIAAADAGAKGMLINVQTLASRSKTDPIGYYRQQGYYRAGGRTAGTTPPITLSGQTKRFLLLGHSGYSRIGGHSMYDVRADSAAPFVPTFEGGYGFGNVVALELQRAWGGMMPFYIDYDWNPYDQYLEATAGADILWDNVNRSLEDRIVGIRRSNILYIDVNSLAGNPSGPPAKWGLWVIRSMDDAMRIINRLKWHRNGAIVTWAYPEDIVPKMKPGFREVPPHNPLREFVLVMMLAVGSTALVIGVVGMLFVAIARMLR